MNLAAAHAHHRGLGGVGGLGAMASMAGGGGVYPTTPSALHQRSPFAIQELLGLNGSQSAAESAARGGPGSHHHHGHHQQDTSAIISASSYLPRSLGGAGHPHGINTSTCPGSLAAQDPASAAAAAMAHNVNPFSSWRPNFMSAFPGQHPGQNLMSFGSHQGHLGGPHSTDMSSGEYMF